jgi:CelD/BcsL family acetyltransferase involved in cellulose biosynthesis
MKQLTAVPTAAFPSDANRAASLTFKSYRGRAGLLTLAPAWAQVLEDVARPEFFHQYAWYDAILQAWPAYAKDTFFLVGYEGNRAVVICPLLSARARTVGIPVRVLAPPDPNYVAYPDIICSDSGTASHHLLPSLLTHLRLQTDMGWDLIRFPRVFSNAPTFVSTADGAEDWYLSEQDPCYYFRCDQGMAAISAQMSSGLRKHIRRCRRQLSDLGELKFVWSRDRNQLPQLLDQFLTLEASGWKGATGEATAIKLDPALVEFYSTLLTRFAESDSCEINLLQLNGRNIAGQFCLLSGGTWYHLKIAYDEEFDKQSPGFVLLEEVLGRLCEDARVVTANFLTGAAWAERWHPFRLDVFRIVARNHTLVGRIALREIKLRRYVRERVLPIAASVQHKLRRARPAEH